MSSVLSAKHFHDEQAAYDWVESRLWPNGPVCPRCKGTERISLMGGQSTRIGTYKCYACRKPFTVKVGTVFESSHIPMNIWLQAIHLMAASKKGFSTQQFARTLGISLKSAWFMSHRIREAMKSDGGLLGGGGGPDGKASIVESDETYFGQNTDRAKESRMAIRNMNCIMTLVDRSTGQARSVVVAGLSAAEIAQVFAENVSKEARIYTDAAKHYIPVAKEYAEHQYVNHEQSEFYKRGNPSIHTQTVENYYSVFKRGMRGTYQWCDRKHLHRYCAEFDFRYSNRMALGIHDAQRADNLLKGVVGRRLTYSATGGGRKDAEALA